MKTRLTPLCLMFSALLTAQISNTPIMLQTNSDSDEQPFGVIPKSFSFDGSNRVYVIEGEQANIYSNAFQPMRTIPVEPTLCADESFISITEKAEKTGCIVREDVNSYYDGPVPLNNEGETIVPQSWSLSNIIDFLAQNHHYTVVGTSTSEEGYTIYLSANEAYYFKYEQYGRMYPEECFLLRDNQIWWRRNYYYECNTYSDIWTEVSREENVRAFNIGLGMYDYDEGEFQNSPGNATGMLTQTLFNEDNQYEYIHFIGGEYKRGYAPNEPEMDCDDRDYKTRTVYCHATCAGFEVLSETGSSLCTVTFPSTFKVSLWHGTVNLIKLDNVYYLSVTGDLSDEEQGILLYKIDRNNSGASVQQVSAPIRIGAYPNPAKTDQTINIQLTGENAGKAQTELLITDIQGKTVGRHIIPAGQLQATVSTKHFAPGMNIIDILQNGKSVGTEKVIVK